MSMLGLAWTLGGHGCHPPPCGWVGDKLELDLLGAVTGPSLHAVPPGMAGLQSPGSPHTQGPWQPTSQGRGGPSCFLLSHPAVPPHPTQPAGGRSEGLGAGEHTPDPTRTPPGPPPSR